MIHLNSLFAVRAEQRGVSSLNAAAERELYKKKLRKEYENNPEARAFLKKHPEFAGFELESTHDSPSNEAYHNSERETTLAKERSFIIQQNLAQYPNERDVKLLTAYYNGATLGQLSKITQSKKSVTRVLIHQTKARVYKWALEQPLAKSPDSRTALESKILIYSGRSKKVYLVQVQTQETFWVTDQGEILPDDIQEILDSTDLELIDLEG